MDQAIAIDIVSDVVCPWCYLGATHLQQALATLPGINAELRWRPFQLDPTIPKEGLDRRAYMAKKFSPERLAAAHDRLVEAGRDAGIDFAFSDIAVSPNTLDAHRVIRWAASAGPGVQDRVSRALFKTYFEDGGNVGDPEVLIRVAGENGMDENLVAALLPTDADLEAVQAEIATAQGMGISGVPCFVIDGRYAIMGAQPVEAMVDALSKVARMKAEAATANASEER